MCVTKTYVNIFAFLLLFSVCLCEGAALLAVGQSLVTLYGQRSGTLRRQMKYKATRMLEGMTRGQRTYNVSSVV